jgi:hypothetical protein
LNTRASTTAERLAAAETFVEIVALRLAVINTARVTSQLPPSMEFILSEFFPRRMKSLSTDQVTRRFRDRRFMRDLEDQCLGTLETYPYVDLPNAEPLGAGVVLYAAGGFSPLSPDMKCVDASCRFHFVDEFARSAGLYADHIVLPDEFTWNLPEFTPLRAFIEMLVVARLAPLVRSGVVQFSRAAYSRCAACKKEILAAQRRVERVLWDELLETVDVFAFKWGRQYRLSFGSPRLPQGDHGVRWTVPIDAHTAHTLPKDQPLKGTAARRWLRHAQRLVKAEISAYAQTLTFDAAMSAYSQATIATHSDLGMLGLRVIDRRTRPAAMDDEAQLFPGISLPYLDGLSTVEVLEVREKAAHALPAFRARLQRDLMSASPHKDNDARARRLAAELRLEVAELEAELRSLRLPVTKRREGLLAVLSFMLTLVGLGTGNTEALIAGGATLAGTLASVHQVLADRERRHAVIKSQPASVLLTAKGVHQHPHPALLSHGPRRSLPVARHR